MSLVRSLLIIEDLFGQLSLISSDLQLAHVLMASPPAVTIVSWSTWSTLRIASLILSLKNEGYWILSSIWNLYVAVFCWSTSCNSFSFVSHFSSDVLLVKCLVFCDVFVTVCSYLQYLSVSRGRFSVVKLFKFAAISNPILFLSLLIILVQSYLYTSFTVLFKVNLKIVILSYLLIPQVWY